METPTGQTNEQQNDPHPNDAETMAEHDQPAVGSEHGIPELDRAHYVAVGIPVQYFTADESRQHDNVGTGPYAAVITQVMAGTTVCLKVMPPFAPSYDVANVEHVDSEAPDRRWRHIVES